jgi:hypothetical protein
MRTTLSLDDDVAAMLEQIRKSRDASLKEVVNAALREGLRKMAEPPGAAQIFRTTPHDAGRCYVPNLDNTAEVLAFAEGENFN